MSLDDERLTQLLLETKTIVMVGASPNPLRPSYRVGTYMADQGYRVIPVNPGHGGKTLFGEPIVPSLDDIQGPVDMLNIFRRSELIPPVVEKALLALTGLTSVWMQLGLQSSEGRKMAEAKGLIVVEDRCLAVEHRRLLRGR